MEEYDEITLDEASMDNREFSEGRKRGKRTLRNIYNSIITKKELFMDKFRNYEADDNDASKVSEGQSPLENDYILIDLIQIQHQSLEEEGPQYNFKYTTKVVKHDSNRSHRDCQKVPSHSNNSQKHLDILSKGRFVFQKDFLTPLRKNIQATNNGSLRSDLIVRGDSRVGTLFNGIDTACKFIFIQLAINWDSPMSLVCNAGRVVGLSVPFPSDGHDLKSWKYEREYAQIRTVTFKPGGDASSQDFVTQLLNDAMDLEESMEKTTDLLTSQSLDYTISGINRRKYDKYGFIIGPGRPEDLVEKATTLQIRSEELRGKNVDKEVSNNVKWENFFISLGNRELHRSQELKNLIRDGVPYQYKEQIWNACVGLRVNKLKTQVGPGYYKKLLEVQEQSRKYNPAAKQIELDLLRTLPHNRHYQTLSSEGIPKLKRVLLAYTQHNPDLGYCQGQNRLAAIALLFLNEEDAFWCLVAITEYLMPPDYYSRTLIAAQVDQRVLKDLMSEKLPQLTSHMERLEVDQTLFTFNWFLTIFVDNIPTETFLRIWDAFLYEGNKVLFRYAMAFFRLREEEITAIQDTMAIHSFLRTMAERAVDIDKISHIAFDELNPLRMRHIQQRRQIHTFHVKGELDELDALRSEFRSSRKDTPRSPDDLSDDDL